MRRAQLLACYLLLAWASPTWADPDKLARAIDERLAHVFAADGIVPAVAVDDATFLRRVSLDLIGRIPTADEVVAFLEDQATDKRARLVDQLLESPDHAAHFARTWRALLLPESDSDRQVRYFVPGFEAWLRQKREERTGFDALVRELIAVPITGTRERPQLVLRDLKAPNPIAFVAAKNASPADLAAATTRLFLGIRLECAQCHDHPFDHWTQQQFWNQAAFFAGIERRGRGAFAPILESTDRRTITVMDRETAVPAVFLDGNQPELPDDASPRQALAQWITQPGNPYFAKAIANRVWAELMGVGIVEPVDDMHSLNPPSHPELLGDLAAAFQQANYDISVLYRAICRSEAYQRTSRQTDPSQQDERLFARRAIKPMTGEQFFDSLAQAIQYEGGPKSLATEDPVRRQVIELFSAHGAQRDPETSVAQALTLMNGRLINRAVSLDSGRVLGPLLDNNGLSDGERIEQLYLRTLSRRPGEQRIAELVEYVAGQGGEHRAERLSDIFWALLNSAEFRWND